MEKLILGIDPGLAIVGFGAISCKSNSQQSTQLSVNMLDFGVITTSAGTEVKTRFGGDRKIIFLPHGEYYLSRSSPGCHHVSIGTA